MVRGICLFFEKLSAVDKETIDCGCQQAVSRSTKETEARRSQLCNDKVRLTGGDITIVIELIN